MSAMQMFGCGYSGLLALLQQFALLCDEQAF